MKDNKIKKPVLGRGLSSLLGDKTSNIQNILKPDENTQFKSIPIAQLSPGPWQVRSIFDNEDLTKLSKSIKENGIIQPIVITSDKENKDKYFIIAGERRWRAAQLAKVHEIPAIIKNNLSHSKLTEISLLENLQRTDLNPLEEAQGYKNLIDKYNYTQEKVGSSTGKSRSHIANIIRLLSLPKKVQNFIIKGKLTVGHVRPLIGRQDCESFANLIVKNSLSVRQVENKINKIDKLNKNLKPFNENEELTKILSDKTGLEVKIKFNPKSERGSITLFCKNLKQFDYVIEKIKSF